MDQNIIIYVHIMQRFGSISGIYKVGAQLCTPSKKREFRLGRFGFRCCIAYGIYDNIL